MDNKHIHGLDNVLGKLAALKSYLKNDVVDVVGTEAVNQFKRNFETESNGPGGQKWASRKTLREGGTNGQKVLSKSGELAESIDYEKSGNTAIIKTDKPYAELHNEGGTITVTPNMKKFFWYKHKEAKEAGNDDLAEQWKGLALAKTLTFPQRQFIGETPELLDAIEKKIVRDLTKILT